MKDWLKVESVLFGSGKYLTEDEIARLSGVPKKSIKHALSELKKHYSTIESSLNVFNEGDSWKLNVRDEFAGFVKNVISEAEMPKAIMETLALIAYKSPVLQSEIIDSRGTGAYEHIALLEEKEFISREKSGRSFKLRTAPKFFEYFDVSGDSKLRDMFKGVKKPEALGNLEVYTAKTDEEKEVEFSENVIERMKKVEVSPSDHEEREKFLDNFDTKFSKAKSDIDETDTEMNEFRRVEPPRPLEWENKEEEDKQEENTGSDDPDDVLKKFDAELAKLDSVSKKEDESEEETEEPAEEEKETEAESEEKSEPVIIEKKVEQEKKSPAKAEVPAKKSPEKKEAKKEEKKESKSKSESKHEIKHEDKKVKSKKK